MHSISISKLSPSDKDQMLGRKRTIILTSKDKEFVIMCHVLLYYYYHSTTVKIKACQMFRTYGYKEQGANLVRDF